MKDNSNKIKVLAQAALCAALCYVGATFIKIDIPVGTESTMFHFGNTFCVLAALLVGGVWGGLAGAVGMTISDLTTRYVINEKRTLGKKPDVLFHFLLMILVSLFLQSFDLLLCQACSFHNLQERQFQG